MRKTLDSKASRNVTKAPKPVAVNLAMMDSDGLAAMAVLNTLPKDVTPEQAREVVRGLLNHISRHGVSLAVHTAAIRAIEEAEPEENKGLSLTEARDVHFDAIEKISTKLYDLHDLLGKVIGVDAHAMLDKRTPFMRSVPPKSEEEEART